ncbi:MAG: bacillithiol biosynthesis cysteine-adding enzyme BshC [Blastocatellia bacterium]
MTETTKTPYTKIPRSSRLYQDFLYHFDRVASFYPGDPAQGQGGRTLAGLVERAAKILEQPFRRAEVASVLREQNLAAGAGEATLSNLDRLAAPDSIAIVTGQQAGLFTGPLYTIFKALTAIKLASQLRAEGLNAVPVFWIASEDHDFAEINHAQVIDREGRLQKITYTGCPTGEGRPVGSIQIGPEITDNLEQLAAALPESEFVPGLLGELREAYTPGRTFAEAFGRMMLRLLGSYGLVLIDPLDERLKQIAGEIYLASLERLPDFVHHLTHQSQALELAGYHAQVHTGPETVPLFLMEEGRRTAMSFHPAAGDRPAYLSLKGAKEKTLTWEEALAQVRNDPTQFSPNVTLRPIVQDFLLPTVALIGGAAEIAYFAQLAPNYALLGRVAPLILPRVSLTLIEKRHAKTLRKFSLTFADLFEGNEAVQRKVVERSLDQTTAVVFDETEAAITAQLERLRQSLQAVDPTLSDALRGGKEKILYQLHNLRTRFIHNRTGRDEVTQHQIERLLTVLFPHRNLQERELTISFFLARYGTALIEQLHATIDPWEADHHLVYL